MFKIRLAIISLAVLLFLSACGSSKPAPSQGEAAKNSDSDLVVAINTLATRLDPQNQGSTSDNFVINAIYDNLVNYDKNGQIIPVLAEKWQFSDDGTQLTFTLRDGARFHDDTPVNADAVKTTFDRVLDKDNNLNKYSFYSQFIDHITTEGDLEVTFHFKGPFSPALHYFAQAAGGIHSPANLKQTGEEVTNKPVGSGPYRLKEWIQGDRIVLEANPNYWGGKPQLASITFRSVPENASRSLMLETGEADLILPVAATDVERLTQTNGLAATVFPTTSVLFLGINTKAAPFDDVRVRQALNYAVDKKTIVEKILLGHSKEAQSFLSEQTWGFSPVGNYSYDPEKARELLKEAGIPEGTKIKLYTPEGRYPMDRRIAEFVQGNFQEIGLDVEFQVFEFGAFQQLTDSKEGYEVVLIAWGASTGDADALLRSILVTGGSSNFTNYANNTLDELTFKGTVALNEEERRGIYKEIQEIVKEDSPLIYLAENTQILGSSSHVEGAYILKANGTLVLRETVKK
ncbi:hypothetical protein EBB07_18890 [Paenibacillaceae bacterium]|nr:hypothetical protein EBB07_18890 [Paenibacillaceae bacterium]